MIKGLISNYYYTRGHISLFYYMECEVHLNIEKLFFCIMNIRQSLRLVDNIHNKIIAY